MLAGEWTTELFRAERTEANKSEARPSQLELRPQPTPHTTQPTPSPPSPTWLSNEMDELAKIVQAQLGGLDTPISESDLISLGLSLGAPLLLDALDLVDRRQGEQAKHPTRLRSFHLRLLQLAR